MVQKIKNLIYWIPFIINDMDFDYTFIYKILYAKLKKLKKQWKQTSCPNMLDGKESINKSKLAEF